jgi:hypothetical protein
MVRSRQGASSLGCLFSILVLATIGYFGLSVGEVYWRSYQYQDDMTQQLRFSSHNSDAQIARHLAAVADSLGLPPSAGRVFVRRNNRAISIESDYYERVEFPGYVRDIHFHPQAAGRY